MQIGLISDTHIREASERLHEKVNGIFQGVDLILHAGDIYNPAVLDELEQMAPVLAAAGDDDYGAVITDHRVKSRHVLNLQGRTLWLLHDSAFFYSSKAQKNIDHFLRDTSEIPDIVVFGHAHYVIEESHSDILFINPGSAMSVDNASVKGSVGILNIHAGEPEIEIFRL